jgi:hypothetical protein
MRRQVWTGVLVTMLTTGMAAQERPVLPGALEAVFPQPATWVARSAVIERDGVAVGQFRRAADGSTRIEWATTDAAGRTIEIRNIGQRRFYTDGPTSGWTSQPMLLSARGWTPPRVSVRSGSVKVATTTDGYDVYERRKPDGTTERRLPALNFLAAPGRGTALTRIVVGAPSSDLFVPPSAAKVRVLTTPGGIVALPAPPAREER